MLRTNLQFVDVDKDSKVFVVTSSLPAEGKTTTATNMAITLAQAGQRVLLIEADLRRPKVAENLRLETAVGLTTVLVGKIGLEDAIQEYAAVPNLSVLTSGAIPPNPAELLQSQAMAEVLVQLRKTFDVVIVDAPPLLPVTDAALLTAQSDGALLVVRHGKTTKEQVKHSMERLRRWTAAPWASCSTWCRSAAPPGTEAATGTAMATATRRSASRPTRAVRAAPGSSVTTRTATPAR